MEGQRPESLNPRAPHDSGKCSIRSRCVHLFTARADTQEIEDSQPQNLFWADSRSLNDQV